MPVVETGQESYRWRCAWLYDLATDRVQQVGDAPSNIWEATWCGSNAVAAVVSADPREGMWYSASLQVIELETGESRTVYTPRDQLGWPAASPSGRHLTIVEAVCSDRGLVAGNLRLIDTGSGKTRPVDTHGVDITHAEWRSDSRLLLAGHRGFETVVGLYDVTSDSYRDVWSSRDLTTGGIYVSVAGLGEAGDCVLVGEGFRRAPEIAVIRECTYRPVRSFDLGYAELASVVESVRGVCWKAADRLEIQGWLLRPRGDGPHPLIMQIHGGPVWHWRPFWLGRRGAAALMLLKRGYAIFYPNPRGSSGRGQDFARHVVGEMGGADTCDLLSGLDHLVAEGIADPKRLGVTGVSYGGFMTAWLITQDPRFAAAIPVAPVTNHVTAHLISNIPHFVSLFLAARYNQPDGKYFQRSPIMHAHTTKTPTLSICGALDRCTPPEEAVQFHNALLENGVESVLVTYPEEGHGVRKFPAAIDYAARVVAWFEDHLGTECSSIGGNFVRLTSLTVALTILVYFDPAVAAASSIDIGSAWKTNSGEFTKALHTGAGFSFNYDGSVIGPEFSKEWRYTITTNAEAGTSKVVLTHRAGLVVTRETRVLTAFGAVEYKLIFKNTSNETLPPISQLQSLDLLFDESVHDGNCVISSGGGLADAFFPPRAFAIRRNCLPPPYAVLELQTEGGRSSNKDLPFFFVQNDAKHEGMFIAFGWSGQWFASVSVGFDKTLQIRGKIPDLNIALRPGEEIQGPTVLVGLYQGTLADGSNRLRRLIREVYTPKLLGEVFLPIATYDAPCCAPYLERPFDERILRDVANAAAEIDQEYFLLDAGWYAGTMPGAGGWSSGLGNWEEVDKNKLPNGLESIASYARSRGLQFGLWFDLERVSRDSSLAKDHPDWVLWKHVSEPETSFNAQSNPSHGLLDFGRTDVQMWVRAVLDRYIRDHDIRYIRYDFNIDPLPYWEAKDTSDRRGVSQLRHIQGLYAVLDWLREQHPQTILEGCASGGRRIDLEMARRFHTFWISDISHDPEIVQFHLFGINYFLPGNYSYATYMLPIPGQKNFRPIDLDFQRYFGGAFGTAGRIDLWPEEMKQKARLQVATWKKLRRYLMQDYYPLGDQPVNDEAWSGWQFHDPKHQSGFVQTFRTRTFDATHRFKIHGLNPDASYRLTDAYGTESFEVIGAAAMSKGVEVAQAPMSSRVFMYERMAN